MGWLFMSEHKTKESLVAYLKSPSRMGPNYEVLASTVRGNRHWYVAQYQKDDKPVRFIGLDLMESGGAGEGWGYKDMDESVGPYYFDCPMSYLDMVRDWEPVGSAAKWRESVRAWHAKRAEKKAVLAPGVVVQYGGHRYRLDRPAGPRKGWVVTQTVTGTVYRMTAPQINQCEVVA